MGLAEQFQHVTDHYRKYRIPLNEAKNPKTSLRRAGSEIAI
jgi:hypothetical protein